MRTKRGAQRGFNLLQVIFTITILGILLAIAVPSFSTLLSNGRRTGAINELVGSAHLARSEALKRGQAVRICATTSAASCTMGVQPDPVNCTCAANTADNWSTGWLVFADRDDDGAVGPNDTTLQHFTNDFTGIRIGATFDAVGDTKFAFRAFNVSAVRGTLTVCDPRGSSSPSERRGVRVDARGRTQLLAADTSGNVTHDGGTVTLTCPWLPSPTVRPDRFLRRRFSPSLQAPRSCGDLGKGRCCSVQDPTQASASSRC